MRTKTIAKVIPVFIVAASAAWWSWRMSPPRVAVFSNWFYSLTEKQIAIFGLVIGALGVLLAAVSLVVLGTIGLLPFSRRFRGRIKESAYEVLKSPEDLYQRLRIPATGTYLARQCLTQAWPDLFPRKRDIIFIGDSGVGKTREAIELIKRLWETNSVEIAFGKGEAIPPTGSPPGLGNNVLLFIDDVRLEDAVKIENQEYYADSRVGRALELTVQSFRTSYPVLSVVLTMPKLQFRALKAARHRFLNDFEVIEIAEMEPKERRTYAQQYAGSIGCTTSDPTSFDVLAANPINSLRCIASFFDNLHRQGKTEFQRCDTEEYCDTWNRHFESQLKEEHSAVLNAVSLLTDFDIEARKPIVELLFFQFLTQTQQLAQKQFDRALESLSDRWLTILPDDVLKLDVSFLSRRNLDDTSKRQDALKLLDVARQLRPRRYLSILSRFVDAPAKGAELEFLNKLTKRLRNHNLLREAREVAEIALTIGPNDSRALFQKGLTSGNKSEREMWYRRALSSTPTPKYASHIAHKLAMMYLSDGRRDEAFVLLDRAYAGEPDDLLPLSLKIDKLRASNISSTKALDTYKKIQKAIRSGNTGLSNRLQAEFACVRFCVEYKQQRHAAARPLLKLARRIRPILDEAPVDATRRASLSHQLAVLCYEQSRLDKARADQYLAEAHVFLQYAIVVNNKYALKWGQVRNRQTNWESIDESEYWSEVERVLELFHQALRAGEDQLSRLHNARVHHAAGAFLWYVEKVAHQRHLKTPQGFTVSAKSEFEQSIALAIQIEPDSQPRREQLTLGYFSLGDYLMTIGGAGGMARDYLSKAFQLSDHGKISLELTSANSFVESFVGGLFLEAKDIPNAKDHLLRAVQIRPQNKEAYQHLAEIAALERDWKNAFAYYEVIARLTNSARYYSWIRTQRKEFERTGVIEVDPEASLRLSEAAFRLDREGNTHINNILDYAHDLVRLVEAKGHKEDYAHAKELFMSAAEKLKSRGDLWKASFVMWDAGRCSELQRGAVDDETIRLYLDSLKLYASQNNLYQFAVKLEQMVPGKVVQWLITAIEEGVRGDFLPEQLANYCSTRQSVLSEQTFTILEAWTNRRSGMVGTAELTRIINRLKAMAAGAPVT